MLVNRIEQKKVLNRDVRYLRGINKLRNRFIHGFSFEFPMPGDPEVGQGETRNLIRILERKARHFRYADVNLADIFVRAGLFDVVDMGVNGRLLSAAHTPWLRKNAPKE